MHDEGDLRAVPAAARRSRRPARRTYVFSCFNQDQPLDQVDFAALRAAPGAERRAGEAHRAVDRPLPEAAAAAGGAQGRLTRYTRSYIRFVYVEDQEPRSARSRPRRATSRCWRSWRAITASTRARRSSAWCAGSSGAPSPAAPTRFARTAAPRWRTEMRDLLFLSPARCGGTPSGRPSRSAS